MSAKPAVRDLTWVVDAVCGALLRDRDGQHGLRDPGGEGPEREGLHTGRGGPLDCGPRFEEVTAANSFSGT